MNRTSDHSSATRSRETQTPPLDSIRPRHLQLARMADIRTTDNDNWNYALNDIHRLNRGMESISLGKVALTIVGGKDIHSMLSQRYDRSYSTSRGARGIQSGIIDTFKAYVKDKREAQSFADTTITFAERIVAVDPDAEGDIVDGVEERPATAEWVKNVEDTSSEPRPWRAGIFVVDSYLQQFGAGAVALSLYPNTELHEEFEEAIDFFQDEGLNTTLISGRKNFHPHATILRAQRPATVNNYRVPRKMVMPEEIRLAAPYLGTNN